VFLISLRMSQTTFWVFRCPSLLGVCLMVRAVSVCPEINAALVPPSGPGLNEAWIPTLQGLISAGHGADLIASISGAQVSSLVSLAALMGRTLPEASSNRRKRHPRAWTPTEYRELIVAWLAGSSARVIAAKIGRSASSIYGKRRFLGLPMRRGSKPGKAATSPTVPQHDLPIAGRVTATPALQSPALLTLAAVPSLPVVLEPLPHEVAIGIPIADRIGTPWLVRNSPKGLVLHTLKRTPRMDWKGNREALWEIGMRQLSGQHLTAAAYDMAVSEDALRSTWSRTGLTRRIGIKSVGEFDPELADQHRKELEFEFLADPNVNGGHFWRRRGGARLSRVFMKSQRYRNAQAAIG
jgi:hypothetical protein